MELGFTKGDWTVESGHIGSKCAYSIKEHNGNAIEDIYNRKLIAAAPKLLEACMTAMRDTEMLLSGECDLSEANLLSTIGILQRSIKTATE